jgi:hypothetical protein
LDNPQQLEKYPMARLNGKHGLVVNRLFCACAAAVVAASIAVGSALAQTEEPPEGVQQLLPRGGIPAVFEPEFVSANEAVLPDSAWVLGVYLNGEARAYDLNLLNHHEVVNDVVGGRLVAPVW